MFKAAQSIIRPPKEKNVVFVPLLVFSGLYLAEFLTICALNDGHFMYTLDDPYIHLALAENILKGHYGVNLGEFSAPSSSILWPFVLAPFSYLGMGTYVSLILNYVLSFFTLHIASSVLQRVIPSDNNRMGKNFIASALIFLMLSASLVQLAFQGMEHSLQVFLAVAVVAGLLFEREHCVTPWWLIAALILGPFVRYENLALSLPALFYLIWRKHYAKTIACGIILTGGLLGFSYFLHSLGLGFMPSSILSKSSIMWNQGRISHILGNVMENTMTAQGALFSVGLFLFLLILLNSRQEMQDKALALWISAALVSHLLMGHIGWFSRYDMYIWSAALLMLAYVYRGSLRRIVLTGGSVGYAGAFSLFLLAVCGKTLVSLVLIPLGANNIYEQQYQMHRFVKEFYKKPVAVNDLGWVAYQNDYYVLDFAGLASRQSLFFRKSEKAPAWMNRLARQHQVELAMIYDANYPHVPEDWQVLGKLYLGKPQYACSSHIVTFYALQENAFSSTIPLLREFRETLPEGVRFVFEPAS